MARPSAVPPALPGLENVRRSFVQARGVRFHVTEAGPLDGEPVLLLHGWPQHHLLWRDLLADPPAGLRLIAPDLPGYGWSGPAPHRWAKEDVASDLLALLDVMGLQRVGLVGHDWGGWIGHLLVLRAPERFTSYLALNIAHLWNGPRQAIPHAWRVLMYQPIMALAGRQLHRVPWLTALIFRFGMHDHRAMTPAERALFAERFADPVCARTGRNTYRTFLLRELPHSARHPETRRSHVPTLCLFGTHDAAVAPALASAETAIADDYRVEYVDTAGHFIVDEQPALVRSKVVELFCAAPLVVPDRG